MLPVGAYLKSPNRTARFAGLAELRPRTCTDVILGVRYVHTVGTEPLLESDEWIEYVPSTEYCAHIEHDAPGSRARCEGT